MGWSSGSRSPSSGTRPRPPAWCSSSLDADIAQVPAIVAEHGRLPPLGRPAAAAGARQGRADDSRQKLHTSLALLPVDPGQVEYLYDRLLDAEPARGRRSSSTRPRPAQGRHCSTGSGPAWSRRRRGKEPAAAGGRAPWRPTTRRAPSWATIEAAGGRRPGARCPVVHLGHWIEALRPVRKTAAGRRWRSIFRDADRRETERSLATDILADYAADRPRTLADLLMDADEKQFAVAVPEVRGEHGERALPMLIGGDRHALRPSARRTRRRRCWRSGRRMPPWPCCGWASRDKVWPLLRHSPDPRLRSYLIHRLGPLGADRDALIERLDEETDVSIRRALLLSLGEFGDKPACRRRARSG